MDISPYLGRPRIQEKTDPQIVKDVGSVRVGIEYFLLLKKYS